MNRIRELPWPRLAVTGVLIVAIAAGIAWYVIRRQQAAKSVAHAPVSVLVGDFANHTGDPVLDNTLEPMLGVALGRRQLHQRLQSRGCAQAGQKTSESQRTNSTSSRRGWWP